MLSGIRKSYFIIAMLFTVAVFHSCEDREFVKKAAVVTNEVLNVKTSTAVATGTVIDMGEYDAISEYGHCWGELPNVKLENSNFTTFTNIRTTEAFTSQLNELSAKTNYYVRAYIKINETEIIYGDEISFITGEKLPPGVTMVTVDNKAPTAAVFIGQVEDIGEGANSIIKFGHCWSRLNPNPTLEANDGFTDHGTTTEAVSFNSGITYLEPSTVYYVRAYAINETGITYSEVLPFETLDLNELKSFNLVNITNGTFTMGDGADLISSPLTEVTLDGFDISKYEITNADFVEFLNHYGSETVKNGEHAGQPLLTGEINLIAYTSGQWVVISDEKKNAAVVHVTWYGANEYCKYYAGRLPTEAEWEYAAIGGAQSNNYEYSGSNTVADVAWFGEYNYIVRNIKTHTVGLKAANELGIYDMSGNAAEWCSDWFSIGYSGTPVTNPQGPATGEVKVVRGGGWDSAADQMPVRMRSQRDLNPEGLGRGVGFRIVFDK